MEEIGKTMEEIGKKQGGNLRHELVCIVTIGEELVCCRCSGEKFAMVQQKV